MNCSMEMPKYKCIKEVWALKIKDYVKNDDGTATVHPEDARYAPINVDADYVRKNDVEIGGYYVVYKGGYASFSPAQPFDEGYVKA